MRIRDKQAAVVAALMVLVALFVLFVLPPAATDSEKAFRLVVAVAALFAAVVRWRRATRGSGDVPYVPHEDDLKR
jgi:hypothetical protein